MVKFGLVLGYFRYCPNSGQLPQKSHFKSGKTDSKAIISLRLPKSVTHSAFTELHCKICLKFSVDNTTF